jgi:periplasmic protein CpxP/Spy
MSLKHTFISVFASALLIGSVAVVVSAQDHAPAVKDGTTKAEKHDRKGFGRHGGFGKGMRGDGFRGMRGLMGIELTEAQKTQIKQIHEANRPDQATLDELKAIHEARTAGTLTEDQKARAKVLRDQMRTKGDSVHQQVLAVLTPEQRQQIETRKAEMQKRREERRQLREQKRQQATPPATINKSTDI